MAHLKALGIKWLYTITVLLLFSLFETMSFGHIFLMSLVIVGVTYLIVDIYLLRIFGQAAAVTFDFGLSFLMVWLISAAWIGQTTTVVILSLIITCILTVCEGAFHVYMKEAVLIKRQAIIIPFPNLHLQSDTSEEVYSDKDNKE